MTDYILYYSFILTSDGPINVSMEEHVSNIPMPGNKSKIMVGMKIPYAAPPLGSLRFMVTLIWKVTWRLMTWHDAFLAIHVNHNLKRTWKETERHDKNGKDFDFGQIWAILGTGKQ